MLILHLLALGGLFVLLRFVLVLVVFLITLRAHVTVIPASSTHLADDMAIRAKRLEAIWNDPWYSAGVKTSRQAIIGDGE